MTVNRRPAARSAAATRPSKTASPVHRDKAKLIEFHCQPTPNGRKISIMLEECGLPYAARPVNIGVGDRFKPRLRSTDVCFGRWLGLAPLRVKPIILAEMHNRNSPSRNARIAGVRAGLTVPPISC